MRRGHRKVLAVTAGLCLSLALGACGGSTDTAPATVDEVTETLEEVVEERQERAADAAEERQKSVAVTTDETQEAAAQADPPKPKELSAGEALEVLRYSSPHVTDVLVWDEYTDANGILGRPGEYISKADFSDDRVRETWTTEEERMKSGLNAGTLEVFATEGDCDNRCEYLKAFMGSDVGILKLNQYIYKYPKAIFRVSYDIVPSEAANYKALMDGIMGTFSEEILPE